MNLDSETFVELIMKAIEKETEDKLWDKWIHDNMELSFEEYKERHKPQKKKNEDEVLKDAENILKSMSRK